ncbi:F-box and WD repeat domain containing protein 10B-like [Physella acuta]|uniref:F-box and WD repeat domain containing protein 10B-like n=1 Tax=Physella acuta TaxID=109671 RepID=UPI0027DC325A|nr:F-box and WD repeat domain containing protein 10B-like [Physella acuta]
MPDIMMTMEPSPPIHPISQSHNSFISPSTVFSEIMKHPSSQSEEQEFNLGKALELRCINISKYTSCGVCDTCLLNTKLREIKEWFFRFGDHSKKRFMLGLFRRIKSTDLLKNLVVLLQPVLNKDGMYARARTQPSLKTDSATVSSDRAINANKVEQLMLGTWEWFAHTTYWTKMNCTLNLLQQCDAHLLQELYKQARTMLASELKAAESQIDIDNYEAASVISTEYSHHTSEHPELDLMLMSHSGYSNIVENPFTGEIIPYKEDKKYAHRSSDNQSVSGASLNSVDPLLLVIPTSAKAYSGVSQHKDFIRCLPVHLAKMILSMLDMVSLYNALCVSPNWRKLAEEVKVEFAVSQQLREEVMLMQGAAAHGANPFYAKDIDVLVPNLDPNTHDVIYTNGNVVEPTFKSEINYETAYSGISTNKVIMEERNVYCGAYNVMVVVDGEDKDRVMHTDGSNFIALGSKDRKVRFIDCETGKEVGPLIIGHAGSIRCCYLLKDKGKVLSGSYDTSVRCWSTETGQCLKILRGHQDTVMAITVNEDVVATGSKDNLCKIWSLETGKCQRNLKHRAPVLAVALSKEFCITGCEAGKVKVWEVSSGNLVKTLTGHHGPVTAIKFDRWHIVSGSKDGYALGWSALGQHSRCLSALRHPKKVLCLEFIYLRVITGSADGRVRIWNLITGQCCRIMRGNSRSDPILSMVALGNRITVNTLNNLLVMNFEPVNWDYSLETDQVPSLVQYGSYSDAPVRSQPYSYIRAQRMRKAGAANFKIVHHDAPAPESNTKQVLLQHQYRAMQLPHSAKSLSFKSLDNARRVQSTLGMYDALHSSSEISLGEYQKLEKSSASDLGDALGQHSTTNLTSSRTRGRSAPSQFSVTIKDKPVEEDEAEPVRLTRRISWAFEKPIVPKDKNISLSEMKALLRSQIRMKTESVVPPDFIYLTLSTIEKSLAKSETNFNTKFNMQDLKPQGVSDTKRPNSSPSRIDPRTKVPVEELGLEMFIHDDASQSESSDRWSVKTKELSKPAVAKAKESFVTITAATPVSPMHHSSLHPSKIKSTVPKGWVIRPISAGPLQPDEKSQIKVTPPSPRPITAPVKTNHRILKSIPPNIAPALPGVGKLFVKSKSQPIFSSSNMESSTVPILMYPKTVKDKASELKELRKNRHEPIEKGPDGRLLGRVSIYNPPMRDHVKFELLTHQQEVEQMAKIQEDHTKQRKTKLKELEKKKKAVWVAIATGKLNKADIEEEFKEVYPY